MGTAFVGNVGNGLELEPDEPIMPSLLQQYEKVVLESVVTAFGIDALIFQNPRMTSIADQHGGYVDTIQNVRKVGIDPEMTYKNSSNQNAYENREAYNYQKYHDQNKVFGETKGAARRQSRTNNNQPLEDAYTGKQIYFLGKSKQAPANQKAELEHVLSTKTIADDRGRVLAGLDGTQLANCPENLKFINKSLNASLGATKDEYGNPVDIPRYIEQNPGLPEETKLRMMKEYKKAKASYEAKIARAYYHSEAFMQDTALAAAKLGAAMGARQLCGFVFIELWFGVREEIDLLDQSGSFVFSQWLNSVANGIKKGFENAKHKYREALSKAENGILAGAMSSITTTFANIFFTTAKNVVRVIRQTWSSLTQAGEVLFLNPANYSMGDRIAAVAKIIATGASIVVGTILSETVQELPVSKIPVVGEIIPNICGSMVTGILSCTLLYFFDRDPLVQKLVAMLNRIHTIDDDVNYYRKQAEFFEEYAAELMKIDLERFQEETAAFNQAVQCITDAVTDEELNQALRSVLLVVGVEIPWGNDRDFDSFMEESSSHLVFT